MANPLFRGWRSTLVQVASVLFLLSGGVSRADTPPAPPQLRAEVPFELKAQGGRYRRYRLPIPAGAVGVRVKVVMEESFYDPRWGTATSLGLGPRDLADPDHTDLFARLGKWNDVDAAYVRLRSLKDKREIPMTEKLEPGSVWTWTLEWAGDRRVIRLNGKELANDPQEAKPEILHLSVSGMRVTVAEIAFAPPLPPPGLPATKTP